MMGFVLHAIIFAIMSLLMTAMAFRVVSIPSQAHASVERDKATNETGEREVNGISNTTNASTVVSSVLSFGLVQTSMAVQTNAYTKAETASNFESERLWTSQGVDHQSIVASSAEAAGSGALKGAAGHETPGSVDMKGAAGHDGVFVKILRNGEPTGQVGKKWDGNTEKELAFYNTLQLDTDGKKLVPDFVAKVESQPQTVGGFQRMVMTDFLFNMPDPSCVMDFKIGKITYDPDSIKDKAKLPIKADGGTDYESKVMKEFGKFTPVELSEKQVINIQRESEAEPKTLDKDKWVEYAKRRKENATAGGITKGQYHRIIDALTGSSERGYRLDGVSVNDHEVVEQELRKLGKITAGKEMKEGCRTIKTEDDVIKWIDTALGVTGNKARVHAELVAKLRSLRDALRTNDFVKKNKFIGSSVLLIFNRDKADVKWIDFAHAGPAGSVDHVKLVDGIQSLLDTLRNVEV